MSYQPLAYDDQDTADRMRADCTACAAAIAYPKARRALDASALTAAVPALTYDDYVRSTRTREIEVSAAAAHLASRLHLD